VFDSATAPLVDSHVHLDRYTDEEVRRMVARAEAAGVRCLLTIGTDLATSRAALALAARYPTILAAVGIHPTRLTQGGPTPQPRNALTLGPSPLRGRGEQRGSRPAFADASLAFAAASDGPVSVKMADLELEGRGFWAGLADGVRLPSQGGDAWALCAERAGGVYTSPALQAEFPCTHVGVHWKTDGGDESALTVELRASRDGQTWMPWRTLQRDMHGPDRPDAGAEPECETFAALVHARLGSWLQARLTFGAAGPATAAVSALTLTCLDSRRAPSPPDPLSLTAGEGASDKPRPLSAPEMMSAQPIFAPRSGPGGEVNVAHGRVPVAWMPSPLWREADVPRAVPRSNGLGTT
jgi:hypothetical protein